MVSNTKPLQPRTARTPGENEQQYVIAHGAPVHYVDGYGRVSAGAIVTLAPGVTPGRWYVEVSPEDAQKAQASESDAQRLAVLAAAKIQAKGNEGDRKRKEAADEAVNLQRIAEAQARAQQEAEGIARQAEADARAQEAKDQAEAERQRAEALQAQLDQAKADLATTQAQLERLSAAEADKPKGGEKSGK